MLNKGPFVDLRLLKKIRRIRKNNEDQKNLVIQTWSRSSTIVPEMLRCILRVHNGRIFIPVRIDEKMIGRKLGEFSPTRTSRTKKN